MMEAYSGLHRSLLFENHLGKNACPDFTKK